MLIFVTFMFIITYMVLPIYLKKAYSNSSSWIFFKEKQTNSTCEKMNVFGNIFRFPSGR